MLCKDNYNIKTLVGQLVWITGQTKSDLAFEVCQLSSILNHSKIDDILKATKHLLKAKIENLLLTFGLSRPIGKFEIVCYNDLLLGNLKNGGFQSGFITYLVGENNVSSPITWKSEKLHRVVKNAIAAETLIQVKAAETCF